VIISKCPFSFPEIMDTDERLVPDPVSASETVTKATVVGIFAFSLTVTYSLVDDYQQFEIDSKTGEIKTTKTPLYCYRSCDEYASTDILDKCEPYSCELTVTTSWDICIFVNCGMLL
jgi:hypothetical protein